MMTSHDVLVSRFVTRMIHVNERDVGYGMMRDELFVSFLQHHCKYVF